MSNYTIQVAWSGKDALADSDPAKVVSGDDFNTEYLAVQTAVNSKAELNGNVSEVFNVVTATAGDNTTKAASTAFVTTAITNATSTLAAVNAFAYPVGSVYTSIVATNPATLLGVGTWSAFGSGRVLVGIDTSDASFNVVEETGGAKTDAHALTVAELPAHTHTIGYNDQSYPDGAADQLEDQNWNSAAAADETVTSSATGSGQTHTHDILQPYVVVYFWKRTA